MKLATGEIATTLSGRTTLPFPKIDLSNNRKAINSLKRIDEWLHTEALAEATYTNNDYVSTILPKLGNKLSTSDKDFMETFLFG